MLPSRPSRKRVFLVHRRSMEAFEDAYGMELDDDVILEELGDMAGEDLDVLDDEVECVQTRKERVITCSLCEAEVTVPPGTMLPRRWMDFICYGCFTTRGDA